MTLTYNHHGFNMKAAGTDFEHRHKFFPYCTVPPSCEGSHYTAWRQVQYCTHTHKRHNIKTTVVLWRHSALGMSEFCWFWCHTRWLWSDDELLCVRVAFCWLIVVRSTVHICCEGYETAEMDVSKCSASLCSAVYVIKKFYWVRINIWSMMILYI